MSSYNINYVKNKKVFSFDMSGSSKPAMLSVQIVVKSFFLDKGVCMKQENLSCLLRGFSVPVCEPSGLF